MPLPTSLNVSPRYLYPFGSSDVFLEGTPLGKTTVTVDPCRAVSAYAPPAKPTGPTMVRSPTIDTVTVGPVSGKAPEPSTVPEDGTVATAGVAQGNPTVTVRPCKMPIPARPRRTGSDMGAISLLTL